GRSVVPRRVLPGHVRALLRAACRAGRVPGAAAARLRYLQQPGGSGLLGFGPDAAPGGALPGAAVLRTAVPVPREARAGDSLRDGQRAVASSPGSRGRADRRL